VSQITGRSRVALRARRSMPTFPQGTGGRSSPAHAGGSISGSLLAAFPLLCAVTYSLGQRCGRLWNSLRSVSHPSVRSFCYILSHSGSCTSHSRSSFSFRRRFARVGAMAIDKESPKEPPAPLCPQCAAPMLLDRDGVVPAAMSHSELTTYTCRPCGKTVVLLDEK
jgi:hypothetical protein